MRFIGNKEKLLDNIFESIPTNYKKGGTFCDFFSGTSNVGRFFKKKGYKVISADLLNFSYVLQKAYIENNSEPKFRNLLHYLKLSKKDYLFSPYDLVIRHLNSVNGIKGFIYKNYTTEGTVNGKYIRKYFTPENGKKIDAIRTVINDWKKANLISDNEYHILLATLIESVPFFANISGVYAAFLKKYDPRALKTLSLKPITIYTGKLKNRVYNMNSMNLIHKLKVDILYIDPPYNNRQYAPNYHLLETIALYDNPVITGVTGMREYKQQKSEFCNRMTALAALDKIAREAKFKCLMLSYNSEGIMKANEILSVLNKHGTVSQININYPRYKSNSNGNSSKIKNVQEQLYILEP